MAQNEIPTQRVLELKGQGKENADIIMDLQRQGFTFQQISEALNQATLKKSVEGGSSPQSTTPGPQAQGLQRSVMEEGEEPPKPSAAPVAAPPAQQWPQAQPSQVGDFSSQGYPALPTNEVSFSGGGEGVEEIAESIIDEKWQKLIEDFGDLGVWKDKVHDEIGSIKQEIMRMQTRFEGLQSAVMGKVKDYDESISDVGVELKALEQLLQNLMNPLTTNIKELKKLTDKLKKA